MKYSNGVPSSHSALIRVVCVQPDAPQGVTSLMVVPTGRPRDSVRIFVSKKSCFHSASWRTPLCQFHLHFKIPPSLKMSAFVVSNLPAAGWYLEIIGCTTEAILAVVLRTGRYTLKTALNENLCRMDREML